MQRPRPAGRQRSTWPKVSPNSHWRQLATRQAQIQIWMVIFANGFPDGDCVCLCRRFKQPFWHWLTECMSLRNRSRRNGFDRTRLLRLGALLACPKSRALGLWCSECFGQETCRRDVCAISRNRQTYGTGQDFCVGLGDCWPGRQSGAYIQIGFQEVGLPASADEAWRSILIQGTRACSFSNLSHEMAATPGPESSPKKNRCIFSA